VNLSLSRYSEMGALVLWFSLKNVFASGSEKNYFCFFLLQIFCFK
jgi:hypothetical protein